MHLIVNLKTIKMKTIKTLFLISAILFAFSFTNKQTEIELTKLKVDLDLVEKTIASSGFVMVKVEFRPGTTMNQIVDYRNQVATLLSIIKVKTCYSLNNSTETWLVSGILTNSSGDILPPPGTPDPLKRKDKGLGEINDIRDLLLPNIPIFVKNQLYTGNVTMSYFNSLACGSTNSIGNYETN